MEAVIWSMLGERNVTSIIYDYWGETWQKDLQKLNCKIDMRKNLGGILPDLKKFLKRMTFFLFGLEHLMECVLKILILLKKIMMD